jgi:hypothetical protein
MTDGSMRGLKEQGILYFPLLKLTDSGVIPARTENESRLRTGTSDAVWLASSSSDPRAGTEKCAPAVESQNETKRLRVEEPPLDLAFRTVPVAEAIANPLPTTDTKDPGLTALSPPGIKQWVHFVLART